MRNTFSTLQCLMHIRRHDTAPPRRRCSPACSRSNIRSTAHSPSTPAPSCPPRSASPAPPPAPASISTNVTSAASGTAARIGSSHAAPSEPNKKVRATQNQVSQRKRAPESQPVRHRPAKSCEKPHQPAEKSRQRARLLHRKMQRLVQVPRQRRKCGVIRKPLEQLAYVRHPERSLKARPYLRQPRRDSHSPSHPQPRDCIGTAS